MNALLVTHVDLDGISPVILLNLTGIMFKYKTLEINEIDDYFDKLFLEEIDTYSNIYVVDLTLTKHVYDLINSKKLNIKVFDHHESHLFANIYDYVNVSVNLNNQPTCGTELFYNYLVNIYPVLNKSIIKHYVKLVKELDTFTFTDEMPRELDIIRSSIGNNEFIKSITKRLKKDKELLEFTAFEKRLLKIKKMEEDNYIRHREESMKRFKIDNMICAIVFAEKYKSDLGNYLATKYNDIDAVIIIDASKSISYRAYKDEVNLTILAEKNNGGGHKHASGSPISDEQREEIVKLLFENSNIDN